MLRKNVDTEFGVQADYHKAIKVVMHMSNPHIYVELGTWISKEHFDAGAAPIARKELKIEPSRPPLDIRSTAFLGQLRSEIKDAIPEYADAQDAD